MSAVHPNHSEQQRLFSIEIKIEEEFITPAFDRQRYLISKAGCTI